MNNNIYRRRVVITGTGVVSPYGLGTNLLLKGLQEERSALQILQDKGKVPELNTKVVGAVPAFDAKFIPRHHRRAMSLMSIYAYVAAKEALAQSGLDIYDEGKILQAGRMGVMAGSTLGSTHALEEFFDIYLRGATFSESRTHTFFKIMSHSVSVSLAQSLNIKGRALGLSGACATGAYALGMGYEAIAFGRQDYVLCGGAEELHPLVAAVFDLMGAATQNYNATPHKASRPFDTQRDGIACAEGAGILILEELASAKARGAKILGEILGFSCNVTTSNLAHPDKEDIQACMVDAVQDAGLQLSDIDYINAHATSTKEGDEAEGKAIATLFPHVPVSSLKGHLGHTMAASGAIESIACLNMLNTGILNPNLNLEKVDECFNGKLGAFSAPLVKDIKVVLKNSFALGGTNTSLVIGRYDD